MDWLLRAHNLVLAFEEDERLLRALAILAPERTVSDRRSATDLVFDLLDRSSDTDSAASTRLAELLGAAGATVVSEIGPLWGRLIGARDLPSRERFRPLFCPLDLLGHGLCDGLSKTVVWPIIDAGVPVQERAVTDVSVRLKGSASIAGAAGLRLILEGAPLVPAGISPSRGSLRISFEGQAEASVSARVPMRLGGVSAAASGESALVVNYFLDADQTATVAATAARHLRSLPDPYDLVQLSAAFDDGRLLALTMEAGGDLELGGAVMIGDSFEIAAGAGASLGLSLGVKVKRAGRFAFTAFPGKGDAAGAVLLDLDRLRSNGETASIGLGLTVVVKGSLAERLLEHAEEAEKKLLQVFTVLLPPSRAMHKGLDREIDRVLAEDRVADLLTTAMGAGDESEAVTVLRERLDREIDAFAGVWADPADRAARSIAESALGSGPLRESSRQLLAAKITDVLTQAIAGFQDSYRFGLESRVINDREFEATADLLAGLGLRVNRAARGIEQRVDATAEPMGQVLGRLQQRVSQVSETLRRSVGAKLRARWQREVVRSEGSVVSQRLLFRPDHPEAAALFRRTLTGSLDEVLARADSQDESAPVRVLDGNIKRFASVDDQSGLVIALLDFSMLQKKLLHADVEIETDQAGNIRVKSAGRVGIDTTTGDEDRSLGIVNVFELATASRTRRMTFAVNLSHRESELSDDEIRQFFRGPEQTALGLIPSGTAEQAIRQLRLETLAEPGRTTHGELKLWLDLDGDQLLRLLQIRDPNAGLSAPVNAFDEAAVYRRAVRAMITANDNSIPAVKIEMRNMRREVERLNLGSDLDDALMRRRDGGFDHVASTEDPSSFNLLQHLDRMRRRASAFVEATKAMREVYLAAPGTWDLKRYMDHQELIDRNILTWVEGELPNRLIFPLINDAIRPYVLSFFKVVVDLAGVDDASEGRSPMAAGLFLHGEDGSRTLMLT